MKKAMYKATHKKKISKKEAKAKKAEKENKERKRQESREELKLKREHEKKLELIREKRKEHEALIALINEGLGDKAFTDFLVTNVGRYAIEVIKRLDTPKTDDQLASELNVKVNEVRRVLNLLGSYGVTRYDSNKDSKGWLAFSWHIDPEKLTELRNSISNRPKQELVLPESCNDFFICEKCYPTNKIVLPFDSAFEHNFKCPECNRPLKRLSKEEAEQLLAGSSSEEQAVVNTI